MRDELKAYCQAIDFNETKALNNLRAILDDARLSKAEDMAKLSALWDRLAFAKQASRNVIYVPPSSYVWRPKPSVRQTNWFVATNNAQPPGNPYSIVGNVFEAPMGSNVTSPAAGEVHLVISASLAGKLAT